MNLRNAIHIASLRRKISVVQDDPFLLLRELNQVYYSWKNGTEYNAYGTDIWTEDWDNLIILDACRYDTFTNRNPISGRLESRCSRGANTHEFLVGNVRNRDLQDTVYVTANPMYYRHQEELHARFHDVTNIWLEDGWDDDFNTVLPKTTTRFAREAAEEYGSKRLVIHYIQPHAPFIKKENKIDKIVPDPNMKKNIWTEVRKGNKNLDPEEIRNAYKYNFDEAIASVETLLNDLNGKTVITADHGNMLGEYSRPIPIREWGHPRGIHTPQLVNVPWLVLDHDERRKITYEVVTNETDDINEQTVADRLSSLGYLDS